MIKRAITKIRYLLAKKIRVFRNIYLKKRNRNIVPSIISMNCVGGIIYHDLGLRFLSPTINMYFTAPDFIYFLENLDECLEADLKFIKTNKDYPVATLNDKIELNFVHYNSCNEAENAWTRRKKRINKDNIYIIMVDRDGFNEDMLERFEKLPYENKILFTAKPRFSYPHTLFLKYYQGKECVGNISEYVNIFGKRAFEIDFDIIDWLN